MNKNKKQMPLQNGEELKPIMIKPNMGRMIKPMAKFPDLSGDGKVTQKDILIGRGVIKKPKVQKRKAVIMRGVTAEDQPTDPLKAIQQRVVDLGRTARKTRDPKERETAMGLRKAAIIERDNLLHARKQDAKKRGGADALRAKKEDDMKKISGVKPSMQKQKTNKTKPTMIKKKAKMMKKPKLGKKPTMAKKPKLGKKPTMAKKPKMGHKKPKMGHKKPKMGHKKK